MPAGRLVRLFPGEGSCAGGLHRRGSAAVARGAGGGRPRKVFVSYSRRDFHAAEAVTAALWAHEPLDPWFDLERLRPGMDWELPGKTRWQPTSLNSPRCTPSTSVPCSISLEADVPGSSQSSPRSAPSKSPSPSLGPIRGLNLSFNLCPLGSAGASPVGRSRQMLAGSRSRPETGNRRDPGERGRFAGRGMTGVATLSR